MGSLPTECIQRFWLVCNAIFLDHIQEFNEHIFTFCKLKLPVHVSLVTLSEEGYMWLMFKDSEA